MFCTWCTSVPPREWTYTYITLSRLFRCIPTKILGKRKMSFLNGNLIARSIIWNNILNMLFLTESSTLMKERGRFLNFYCIIIAFFDRKTYCKLVKQINIMMQVQILLSQITAMFLMKCEVPTSLPMFHDSRKLWQHPTE